MTSRRDPNGMLGDGWPRNIARSLDHSVDPHAMHRLWRGAKARRALGDGRRLVLRTATVSLLLATALVVAAWYAWGAPDANSRAARHWGHLTLHDGRIPESTQNGEIRLSDGSEIRVDGGARWTPLRNNPKVFESEMTPGVVAFSVTPGGPRRWTVHAGSTTVSVLGTRFVVDYRRFRTEVRVERGRVRVEDERLAQGSRLLRAGEHIELTMEGRDQASEAVLDPSTSPSPAAPVDSMSHANPSRPTSPTPSRTVAATPSDEPVDDRADSVTRLIRRADRARMSGDPLLAARLLEQVLVEYEERPEAPVAAIVLGRMEMDQLGRRQRARRAFELAQRLGVPPMLRAGVDQRLRELR